MGMKPYVKARARKASELLLAAAELFHLARSWVDPDELGEQWDRLEDLRGETMKLRDELRCPVEKNLSRRDHE